MGARSSVSRLPRSRAPRTAAAAAGGEHREQRPYCDRDLQRQADGLTLLDEVDRLVRRNQIGRRAEEHAVGNEQGEAAAA